MANSRTWLVPALIGVLAGGVLAVAPLGYYVSQLNARLATSSASVAQLTAANTKLQADKESLQLEQAQLQQQTQSDQAALQASQERSTQLAKPDLPLELTFGKKPFGGAVVLWVRNASPSSITVIAQVVSAGVQSRPVRYTFAANRKVFLNHLTFGVGDKIIFVNPSFRPKEATYSG